MFEMMTQEARNELIKKEHVITGKPVYWLKVKDFLKRHVFKRMYIQMKAEEKTKKSIKSQFAKIKIIKNREKLINAAQAVEDMKRIASRAKNRRSSFDRNMRNDDSSLSLDSKASDG